MPIVEALVLILFGIVLPTWDVGSDIALSHSFLSTKPCFLPWEEYVRDYKNGVEPPVNQNIGEFISDFFLFMNNIQKFEFQTNFAILMLVNIMMIMIIIIMIMNVIYMDFTVNP